MGLLLTTAALIAQPAQALPSASAGMPEEVRGVIGPTAPGGEADTLLRGIAFDLSVSTEESKVSAQVGGYWTSTASPAGDRASQLNYSWALKLAVPIGGEDDLSEGATLDRLADGPALTATLGIFGFRSATRNLFSPRFRTMMLAAIKRCRQEAETAQAFERCNAAPDPDFAMRHSGYSAAEVNSALLSGVWQAGFEASVGVESFDYIEGGTLETLSQTEVPYSLGLFGALYPADGRTALIARLKYQNSYEAADAAVVCKPVVVDPEEDCESGSPSPPQNVERVLLSGELRLVAARLGSIGWLAFAPKSEVDLQSGDYSFSLPAYLVPAQDWPVSPGVKISYSSEEEEVAFGVFLRSTFSF